MKESSRSKFYPSGSLLMIPLLTIIFSLGVAAQTYQGRILGSVADQNGASRKSSALKCGSKSQKTSALMWRCNQAPSLRP
jgi:hypothetical protein